MTAPLRLRSLELTPLAIPMRLRFEHAAASRQVADPLIARVEAQHPYEDVAGWGEGLARHYVTGESADSVRQDIETYFLPVLSTFRAGSFAETLQQLEGLPFAAVDGRRLLAARALVELAVLDLAGRCFRRSLSEVGGWLGASFVTGEPTAPVRYSGIVIGKSRRKLTWLLRAQRWYGLTDFKLKVASPGWRERLGWTAAVLRREMDAGRVRLRVDANGGWDLEEARAAIPELSQEGVSAVEQPLSPADDEHLFELSARGMPDLVADESLCSAGDAQRLLNQGAVRVFNIRIAKVGGIVPALRMAQHVLAAGRDVQLGCLVGETSLLTAAGYWFLQSCPRVRFLEGAFGSWLLRNDVTRRPLTFGYGGRLNRLPAERMGLGIEVEPERVRALAGGPAVRFAL